MDNDKKIRSVLDLPEGSSKKVGYVLINTELFNPEEDQEATNFFLDFVSDCIVHEKISKEDIGQVRLLVEHKRLNRVHPFTNIPYYSVKFNPDGSYKFTRDYKSDENKLKTLM